MRRFLMVFVMFCLMGLFALPVNAQFGKNVVIWEKTQWYSYQSEHFDYYVSLDLKVEEIQPHFNALVEHLENSYQFLSVSLGHNLSRGRPIVVVSRTHSQFEGLPLSGEQFMPEGVGAYAFPRGSRLGSDTDLVLVVKPDFLPMLNRTIYTHELTHIFQFDMLSSSVFQRMVGAETVDQWIYEATADYMANIYAPYSRDDIRKIQQRVAAANTKNPMMGLPTLEMLVQGQANPYSMGSMVFEFLDALYGRERVYKLIADIFGSKKKLRFLELLEDLSNGEFKTSEIFDRAHRDYWAKRYVQDSLDRPQPYNSTINTRGRQIVKQRYPYPLMSPVTSRDGKFVAFLTADRKSGIVLAIAKALPREDPIYIPRDKRKKRWIFGEKVVQPEPEFKLITTDIPPKPYEYIVAQGLETWPFNGSDIDWWQDLSWTEDVKSVEAELKRANEKMDEVKEAARKKKAVPDTDKINVLTLQIKTIEKALHDLRRIPNVNKIVFFARHNQDHAMFIKDVNTGKLSHPIEIPLDQAFSPRFSPDSKTVYFSAAKNIDRDLYSFVLETKELKNLTKGHNRFNSAPAISPDGMGIVYVAFPEGSDFQKLFLFSMTTGDSTQLTHGRFNDNSPSWSSDGKTIVYTSDEKDNIWNLYTFSMDGTVKQWTDVYGGVFTPSFAPGESDRVAYTGFFETDQYHYYIFPNFKLFDAKLKEPLRIVENQPVSKNMQLAFRTEEIISQQLDQRQIKKLDAPPERWKMYGRSFQAGYSGYYGGYAFGQIMAENLLSNKIHAGTYAQNGSFRYIDYTYVNSSRRWTWAVNGNFAQYPLFYQYYNFNGDLPRYPKPDDSNQYVFNSIWANEKSATLFAQYPFNKWDRVEFGIRARQRNFLLPFDVTPDQRQEFVDNLPSIDVQFYDLFSGASQNNLGLSAAFVHDTVIYSRDAGPLHGLAFRGQAEFGPPLSTGSSNYFTASFDLRRYFRLAGSTLAAVRGAGMTSTRTSGDFMFLGGTDMLAPYSYSSVAGNQVIYGRGDLRFPFADVIFGGIIPVDVRGVLFADFAKAKFTNDTFPTQSAWSYGLAFQTQVFIPLEFGIAKTQYSPDKFTPYIRIGFGF